MANDFYLYKSVQFTDFDNAVTESKSDNNSFSVLTWSYRGNKVGKLYTTHVYATDEDSDFYYELYWVSSGGDDIQNPFISSSTSTAYVCPVRYSKVNLRSRESIRLHPMKYSDFSNVFGGNIKNSSIYTWHGNDDQSFNYYWHGYSGEPTEDDWRIIDGNLPFKTAFPTLYTINDAPSSMWKIIDGSLPHKSSFPTLYTINDAPSSMWKIIDGDLPFKSIFPKMYDLTPEHSDSVLQGDYVCVFDMHNPQNQFNDNGICILSATKCEIAEELNGLYELSLEHPVDREGRWTYLLELNIIKAGGQLWRIYNKDTKLNSDGSKTRIIKARHIFYDLNDKLLEDVRPENKKGVDFISWVMTHIYNDDPDSFYPQFTFSYASDIERTATSYFIGTSVIGALLGEDNCFLNRLGGEIYRDNFYFSINENKEGSQQEAFSIRYGVDMIDVDETIDYSDMMTNLIAKDNFGHNVIITHGNTPRIAHHISKAVSFSYENEEDSAAFEQDAQSYFNSKCYPKINYKVNYANLQNADLYKDFIGLQECNVGDTGYIYCEELGISTLQKIIKKTTDVLTGNTISIELGNMQDSLTRKDKYSSMVNDKSPAAKAAEAAITEARKAFAASLKTWGDCLSYTWQDLRVIKWNDLLKTEVSDE